MSDGLKLLSSVLAVGSSRTLSEVRREHFVGNEATAYDFIRSHLRSYRELPTAATVQEETRVRLPTANETLDFYLNRVHDRWTYNEMREHYAGFREGMQSRDLEVVGRNIASLSRIYRSRRSTTTPTASIQINDALAQVTQRLVDTRGTGGITGITTGWTLYDHITGGYQDSDLISLVARPGVGKTYLLLRQAERAHRQGKSVLFVTTELGTEQIGRRFLSVQMGINPTMLKTGMVSTHLQRRIERMTTSMVGADRFHLMSVGMGSTVDNVINLIHELGPDIVYIDGVYLLKPSEVGKNASRVEKVTGVYDELKGANLSLEIPFVVTTQFSRQAGKGGKEGTLETIGYADAIGTHSSIVVAIKPGPTANPRESRYLEFLKGREGEDGQVAINFKFAPLDMEEFTPEQTAEVVEEETAESTTSWMV